MEFIVIVVVVVVSSVLAVEWLPVTRSDNNDAGRPLCETKKTSTFQVRQWRYNDENGGKIGYRMTIAK